MVQRSLKDWIFLAFTKQALVPLLVVEIALLVIFYFSIHHVYTKTADHLRGLSESNMNELTSEYASRVELEIGSITAMLTVYRDSSQVVLEKSNFTVDESESQRRKLFPSGVYATFRDNGGAASFYSAATPVDQQDHQKSLRLTELDTLMKSIVQEQPLISQIYLNTRDNYTHIYPYIDAQDQFAPNLSVSDFNFFYLATPAYNPEHKIAWTPIYLDPAGQGWMISAIQPILSAQNEVNEVVGVDITLAALFNYIRQKEMPWNATIYLIDENRNILLSSETNNSSETMAAHENYEKVLSTLELDTTTVREHPKLQYVSSLYESTSGQTNINLENGDQSLVTWEFIPSVNWKLVTLVDETDILMSTASLEEDLSQLLNIMLIGLLAFYSLYFIYMSISARSYGRVLSNSMAQLNEHGGKLAAGHYDVMNKSSGIKEIDSTRDVYNTLSRRLKATINELQDRERFVSYAMHASGNFAFRVNFKTRIVELDDQLSYLFGLQNNCEITLSEVKKLLGDTQYQLCKVETKRMFNGAGNFSVDLPWTALGEDKYFWISGSMSDNHTLLGTVTDITEKKQLEASLTESERQAADITSAKSTLMSSITHELRTPLTSLVGFTDLLKETDMSAEQCELVEQLDLANRDIKSIIDDLIVASLVYSNSIEFHFAETELASIIHSSLEFVEPLRESKKINMHINLSEKCIAIVDPERLKYALIQILTNAIRYNDTGHDVYVSLQQVNDRSLIIIQDNGYGIAQDMLNKALQPFSRAGRENLSTLGLGIGLSLSKELIERMNGALMIESELEIGTKVQISLKRITQKSDITANEKKQ